jgi:hypothetical protein
MALNRRNPIWPYLLVLAVLFALSIAAPRGWQHAVQEKPAEAALARSSDPRPSLAAEIVRPSPFEENRSRADVLLDAATLETKPQPEASFDRIGDRITPSSNATNKSETSPVFGGPFWPADENWPPAKTTLTGEQTPSSADTPAPTLATDEGSGQPTVSTPATEPAPQLTSTQQVAPAPTEGPQPTLSEPSSANATATTPSPTVEEPAPKVEQQTPKVDEPAPQVEEPSPVVPIADPAWPRPVDLYRRLEGLERFDACQQWANDVKSQFDSLTRLAPRDCDAAETGFVQLRRLVSDAESLVPELRDNFAIAELRRTQHAIIRRIDIWEQISAIRHRTASTSIAEGTERLLDLIERYETDGRTSDARCLAEILRQVRTSPEPDEQELARRLGVHYRNANLRIAITSALMNRMLPTQQPLNDDVNETILGNPVQGTSTISNRLSVHLIPDERSWRFDLVADGTVDSRTRATHGSFTFTNAGQATYQIHKRIVITPDAVKVYSAAGDANNTTELQGLRTSFDAVPLFGSLIRSYAVSKEQSQQDQANWEAQQKVAAKAIGRMNSETNPRLAQAHDKFQHQLLEPMRKLALDPAALEMKTTDVRLSLRSRLAGADQLGAHTPRPEAPSSSLVSTQIHESTLNNMLDHLDLAGRTFTLIDLRKWLSDKLGREFGDGNEDLPEGVHVTFARQDPIRVRCDANHLELILNITEIRDARRRWHDFEVRATYRPIAQGLAAQFERDGTIVLGGQYKGKPEVALRGIFSKVLSRERKLNLLPETIVKDQRLAGLEVTQLVVEDGWIATAIGPFRTAGRSSEAAK